MGHQNYVNVTAFSQHDLLATHSQGEDIRLWNAESGKLLRVFKGYSRLIGANAFSPDGRLLVQGDASGRIRVWDVANHRYRSTIQGHTGPIWTIEFSPDGRTFATAGDDRFLRIWNVASLDCIKTFPGLTGRVWSLAFNHDGSLLATGGLPHGIRLWDPDPEADTLEVRKLETSDDVWSLTFSPSGEHLVSGHTNGAVLVWDIKAGQIINTMKHGTIPIGAIRFTSDGKTLITSNNQHLLKFWNWVDGECTQMIPLETDGNRTKAVTIGDDGKLVVTGSSGSRVYLWNTEAMNNLKDPLVIEGHTSRVWTIALSRDGRFIASSDEEGTTLLSDVQLGSVVEQILIDRPYERMNIEGVVGLNAAERAALKALGAVEAEP
jgi:WD40 repeat protein